MLATMDPKKDQIPPVHELRSVEDYEALGVIPGKPASTFAARWDKRDDYEAIDLGDVGEDANGVFTRVHPDTLLQSEPRLWDAWIEWCHGQREITAEDYKTKSAYELECKIVLVGAHAREHDRRLENLSGR